jgi:DNA polymerase-1
VSWKANQKGIYSSEGNVILSADYSQIELRLLAHFSEEPKLIEAYQKNKDLLFANSIFIVWER